MKKSSFDIRLKKYPIKTTKVKYILLSMNKIYVYLNI